MTTIYLGLGSNLGDRETNIREGLAKLAPELALQQLSKYYETEPMYKTEQPKFLNAAARCTTELSAEQVLEKLKTVEKEMGEYRHHEPRVIDLDLLFYGDEVIETPELVVPHAKLIERRFVLEPLNEIAPGLVHPVLHTTISELFRQA